MQSYSCVARLTKDPVQSPTKNGSVVNFGLAVNLGQDETLFWNCTAWNEDGNRIVEYFKKGKPGYFTGHFKPDKWEDKEGNTREGLKFIVTNSQFINGLGGNKPNETETEAQEAPKAQPAPKKPNSPKGQPKNQTQKNSDFVSSGVEDDDIPF